MFQYHLELLDVEPKEALRPHRQLGVECQRRGANFLCDTIPASYTIRTAPAEEEVVLVLCEVPSSTLGGTGAMCVLATSEPMCIDAAGRSRGVSWLDLRAVHGAAAEACCRVQLMWEVVEEGGSAFAVAATQQLMPSYLPSPSCQAPALAVAPTPVPALPPVVPPALLPAALSPPSTAPHTCPPTPPAVASPPMVMNSPEPQPPQAATPPAMATTFTPLATTMATPALDSSALLHLSGEVAEPLSNTCAGLHEEADATSSTWKDGCPVTYSVELPADVVVNEAEEQQQQQQPPRLVQGRMLDLFATSTAGMPLSQAYANLFLVPSSSDLLSRARGGEEIGVCARPPAARSAWMMEGSALEAIRADLSERKAAMREGSQQREGSVAATLQHNRALQWRKEMALEQLQKKPVKYGSRR